MGCSLLPCLLCWIPRSWTWDLQLWVVMGWRWDHSFTLLVLEGEVNRHHAGWFARIDCFDLVMQTIGGTKNLRRKLRDMSLSPGRRGRWRLPQKIAYSQHLLLQFIEIMPGSWKNTKEKEKINFSYLVVLRIQMLVYIFLPVIERCYFLWYKFVH